MAARCDVRTDVSVGWWGLGVGPGTRASQISLAPLGWGSRGDGRAGGGGEEEEEEQGIRGEWGEGEGMRRVETTPGQG